MLGLVSVGCHPRLLTFLPFGEISVSGLCDSVLFNYSQHDPLGFDVGTVAVYVAGGDSVSYLDASGLAG